MNEYNEPGALNQPGNKLIRTTFRLNFSRWMSLRQIEDATGKQHNSIQKAIWAMRRNGSIVEKMRVRSASGSKYYLYRLTFDFNQVLNQPST